MLQPVARIAAALRSGDVPGWAWALLCGVSALLGLAIDRIGPSGRINILAPPVLALLAWNGLVYVVWLGRALVCRTRYPAPASSRLLIGARAATALHLAAAVLAIALLASMYARGLAFEYRAGWDSTFLDAHAVHRIIAVVLGPAAALSGIALPDPQQLAGLRYADGGGESAARWIHLYALTVFGAVVLPRLALAAGAALAARRLAGDIVLAVSADESLRQRQDAAPLFVPVLPYAHSQAADAHVALRDHLARQLGRPVEPLLLDNVPLGAVDLPAAPDADPAAPLVLLFNLTATPEAETHAAFVRTVQARWPQRRLLVIVDETAFRARLGAEVVAARLEPRRSSWRQALAAAGAAPVFVDLSERGHG